MTEDLDILRQFSSINFKKIVKKEAKEKAFEELSYMKEGHSQMQNLQYTEIKMQNYMQSKNLKLKEALNIFQARTHMAKFGENYKDGADLVMCSLCNEDLDNLRHSFLCEIIRKELDIKGDISEVYSANISKETAQTVTNSINLRKKLLENMTKI